MKQSVLFIVILFATSSCLKEDKRSNDPRFISVEEYIVLLKSGNFDIWMIPIFEISDIPALLKHARNEQIITVNTTPSWSSAFYAPTNVSMGMMMLWTIEGARLDVDHPSNSITVVDAQYRVVSQSKVANQYELWWSENKGKTIEQLKKISPFEGTDFSWD